MISNNLLEFFEVPKYLNVPCSGLSVSDNHIRFISLGQNKKGLFLENYGEYELSPGSVVAGNVNNTDELKEIFKKIRSSGVENIRACIPEEQVYLFEMVLESGVSIKDIRSAIEFKIEENVPLKADDIIFDYFIKGKDQEGRLFVVVSALPKKIVELYQDLIIGSGFNLYFMGIESQSIALSVIPKSDFHTNIIVHFSRDKMGLYIIKDRIAHFTSTFSFVGQPNIQLLSSEINKVISYWHTNKKDFVSEDKISEIYLCGENFNPAISEDLFGSTGIKTSVSNVWQNAFDINVNVPKLEFKDSLRYASAIGLSLPSDILI